jgi:hypothetical protein
VIVVPAILPYKIESPVFVMVVPTTAKDVKLPKSMELVSCRKQLNKSTETGQQFPANNKLKMKRSQL